jgi:hypothetical protein
MRKDKLAASVITVFIETSRFDLENRYSNSATLEMIYPSESTQELIDHCFEATLKDIQGRIWLQAGRSTVVGHGAL